MPIPLIAAAIAAAGGKAAVAAAAGSTIFKALLGGIAGRSKAKLEAKTAEKLARNRLDEIKLTGLESRKSSAFESDLLDFSKQRDKVRKRAALDTYGQFSQISRWSPNYVANNPAVQISAPPVPQA